MLDSHQLNYIEKRLSYMEGLYIHRQLFNIDWEEIKQNIRLHFYKKMYQFDKTRPFEPWAKTIIYCQYKNQIRNQINRNLKRESSNYQWMMENCKDTNFFFKDNLNHIGNKLFQSLSEQDKQIFNLRFDQNLQYKEIAKVFGWTRRNVYTRIQKIKNLLPKIIEKEEFWF